MVPKVLNFVASREAQGPLNCNTASKTFRFGQNA